MAAAGRGYWARAFWFLEQVRAGALPTARAITDRFEVSLPTARRVIDGLRDDLGAPLFYDRAKGGWALSDPSFDLPRLPVSAEELAALALARSLFRRVTTPSLARAIDSLLAGRGASPRPRGRGSIEGLGREERASSLVTRLRVREGAAPLKGHDRRAFAQL